MYYVGIGRYVEFSSKVSFFIDIITYFNDSNLDDASRRIPPYYIYYYTGLQVVPTARRFTERAILI